MVRLRPVILASCTLLATHAAWSDNVTELPKKLQSGVPAYDLAASDGHGEVFRIEVPPGSKELVVQTAGGEGDANLYVQKSAHPTTGKFFAGSQGFGTRERVIVESPAAGTWYVLVHAEMAFSGVRLSAKISTGKSTAPIPRLSPAPGEYPEPVRVFLGVADQRARIRYTLDGSEPTASSPIYKKPLLISQTTRVRAAAFLPKGEVSTVADANYTITPGWTPIPLASGIPTGHRGGNAGSEALFQITVPDGVSALRVFTGGGTGDSEIMVQHGRVPAKGAFAARENGPRNSAMLSVPNPAPGEWYIMLRGKSHYSGAILTASYQVNEPDLVVWPDRLEPYVSESEVFEEEDCEVVEGMIQPGTRRLLRFSTESRNLGGADVILGRPEDSPELFEYQDCHGHYHFRGFAAYRLLKQNGDVVTTGSKVSFCLEDVIPWDIWSPRWSKYDCGDQGIQVGWSDIYDSGLPGQWIDITGVPAGDYILEVTINPDRILPESDYSNNSTRVPVTIPPAE